MEANSNDNYVLVLEDRTEVKNQQEAGKLTIVSGIDDKGDLKTTEALAANQAAFCLTHFLGYYLRSRLEAVKTAHLSTERGRFW